jgi:hypothetical protein
LEGAYSGHFQSETLGICDVDRARLARLVSVLDGVRGRNVFEVVDWWSGLSMCQLTLSLVQLESAAAHFLDHIQMKCDLMSSLSSKHLSIQIISGYQPANSEFIPNIHEGATK